MLAAKLENPVRQLLDPALLYGRLYAELLSFLNDRSKLGSIFGWKGADVGIELAGAVFSVQYFEFELLHGRIIAYKRY